MKMKMLNISKWLMPMLFKFARKLGVPVTFNI